MIRDRDLLFNSPLHDGEVVEVNPVELPLEKEDLADERDPIATSLSPTGGSFVFHRFVTGVGHTMQRNRCAPAILSCRP